MTVPQNKIEILFQDSNLVVVDKPVGISVHNTQDEGNLLELLQVQLGKKQIFPVHRLDKETSGVQILALTESAAKKLADEFQGRNVKKMYRGIVRGALKEQKGVWSLPLTDKAEGRNNPQGITKDRVACETHYQVLKINKYFSLLEFDLLTGRQHQIRKHAALAKHHLVGDPRYGEPKYNQKITQIYKADRMFLHCWKIEISGKNFASENMTDFETLFRE